MNDDWRELAARESDGLEISLLWSPSADRVKVTVLDQRLDELFDLDVDPANALRAFEHPFAYPRRQTVTTDDSAPRPRTLRQQA